MRFAKGALQRQLDIRGIGQEDFSKIAMVSPTTVLKGCKGAELTKTSGRKILVALSVIPVIAPEGLEVSL